MPAKRRETKSPRRRKPKQARAQFTVEAILIAAAELLTREGVAGMTTTAIAQRAGVSVGSLYQYFGGREELLEELTRRHVAKMQAIVARTFDEVVGLTLEQGVRLQLEAAIAAHRLEPELDAALSRYAPGTKCAAILDEFEGSTASMFATVLRALPELEVARPELAGRVLADAIGGSIRQTLRQRPERLDDPDYTDLLVDLVLGYLDRQARTRGFEKI